MVNSQETFATASKALFQGGWSTIIDYQMSFHARIFERRARKIRGQIISGD
jgi:hypothetical protein